MMHKLNALLGQHDQLNQLARLAQANALINAFWQTSAPDYLASASCASHIEDGVLIVFASNASVASKIKLTQASLLKALEIPKKLSTISSFVKLLQLR